MRRRTKVLLLLLTATLLIWASTAVFIVGPTETGIITRFSRPLPAVCEPGPHLKFPWPVDEVLRFDQKLLVFDHAPTEFLTQDKKNVLVDSYAVWKIGDEHTFLATVRNREAAEARLLDMMTAALGEVVGSYPLASFINTEPGKVRLREINEKLLHACAGAAKDNYGIEIKDVRINAFNFPPQNLASVIKRMQAERDRIATRYRAQGDEEALKIEAQTEKERRKILAEAQRRAKEIKGDAEAEAIRIYGSAYDRDPEFYRFLRTLEAYDKIIDPGTTIILRSDSELWRMLEKGAP